jgi:hypothetical protein
MIKNTEFVETTGRVDVRTVDLARALKSVAPHAVKSLEIAHFNLVRVYVDRAGAYVTATNGYTAGMAEVGFGTDDVPDVGFYFDLSLLQATEIVRLFKADAKKETPDEYAVTSIVVDEKHVRIRDVSGMFPGKEFKFARIPMPESVPYLLALFRRALQNVTPDLREIRVRGDLLKHYAVPAKEYDSPVLVKPWQGPERDSRPGMIVMVGDQFLGMLMHLKGDDTRDAEEMAFRSWERRLSVVGDVLGESYLSLVTDDPPPVDDEPEPEDGDGD